MTRFAFRLSAFAAALVLAACGATTLKGISALPDMETGALAMTEVHRDGTTSSFPLKAEKGKLLALYLGYTNCPDLCPTTLADLGYARDILKKQASDVVVGFATIDPNRDTPTVLTSYLNHFSFGTSGHALRPTAEELQKAEQTLHASSSVDMKPDGSMDVGHTSYTYVINDTGKVVDEFPYGTTANSMASDFKVLLR